MVLLWVYLMSISVRRCDLVTPFTDHHGNDNDMSTIGVRATTTHIRRTLFIIRSYTDGKYPYTMDLLQLESFQGKIVSSSRP